MFRFLSSAGHKIAGLLNERVDYGVRVDSPSRNLINQYFKQFPISALLPYQGYDLATQLFYNDGSVGFIFETSPLVGCTEEMQREISGLFQHTLPEGSSIQFLLWADPRIGNLLQNWQGARQNCGEIFQTLSQRRVDFLKASVFHSPIDLPLRNFRCIVAYSQGREEYPLHPLALQKLLQTQEQVRTALLTLGMPVTPWDATDLLNTLDGLINFNHQTELADLKWNPHDSLNLQIPSTSTNYQIARNGVVLNEDEALIRTYSVRREPDQWSLYAMGELIGDPLETCFKSRVPF